VIQDLLDGLLEARKAADDLVAFAFGEPVAKVKKSIATPQGFDAVVLATLEAIKGEVAGTEAEAMKAFLAGLEKDWPTMKAAARTKAVNKAAHTWLEITRHGTPPAVGKVLATKGLDVVAATKKAVKAKHKLAIEPSLSLVDQKAVEYLAQSQVNFVTLASGKKHDYLSGIARGIVADGLSKGHDSATIGASLKKDLIAVGKSDNYWRMLAGVFVARARTWSTLSSFSEAGITTFQYEAVLDEVTSDVCRYMHGKTFRVGMAVSRFMTAEQSPDPEDVKDLQPWVSVARTGNDANPKEKALFFKQGGTKNAIALVRESGVGKKDAVGRYQPIMSDEKLQAAGIATPPLHGGCRSTIVPVFGARAAPALQFPPTAPPAPSIPPAPPPVVWEPPRPAPRPTPPGFADPNASLVFSKTPGEGQAGAFLNGVPFGPPSKPEFWKGHKEVDLGESPLVASQGKKPASGVIIVEPDGRMWLVEPTNHFGGYEHTFPKGKTEPGLSLQQNALKEAYEESGLEVEIVGHVGDFEKSTSTTRYYLARRKGGEPWKSHFESQTVKLVSPDEAKKLLNVKVDRDVLDAALTYNSAIKAGKPPPPPVGVKLPKPPRAPKPAAPAKAPLLPRTSLMEPSNVLHQLDARATGSNVGDAKHVAGFYTGKDGVKRYVKFYDKPAQAYGEHLTNQLYRDLGIDASESALFDHEGKIGYASRVLDGAKQLKDVGLNKARANKILDGFAADAFTANWDVVGLNRDNIVELPDGRLVRIDNGGALLFRARGAEKDRALREGLSEWTFFPEKNQQYRPLFEAAGIKGPDDMRARAIKQVEAILDLEKRAGGWDKYVAKHVPLLDAQRTDDVVEMLNKRTAALEKRLAELRGHATGAQRYVAKKYSDVKPSAGLTLGDLPTSAVVADHYGKIDRYRPDRHTSGEAYSSYKKRAEKAVEKVSANSRSAISSFTGSGYGSIRASEEKGAPNERSDSINRAYEVATPEPGTVFRGIANLPKSAVDGFLERPKFGLGPKGSATSSTSWLIDVSIDGFMGGGGMDDHKQDDRYKILYVLTHKTGIPVSSISGHTEHEVLMSRTAKFRTTGLSRAPGTKRVLIVEAEEITDDDDEPI
jgi:ADP-ribose pyrophosphatase YjhB (NUDIX family)